MNVTFEKLSKVLTTPIPNPFAYWFQNEFAPMMPRQWKRVLYIASIVAMTSFSDQPDFVVFSKINELLKLTYKSESYWIPKLFRNMIWKFIINDRIELNDGRSVPVCKLDQRAITQEELLQICDYLIQKTPAWIIYAPEWFIRRDLIRCLSELFNKRFDTQLSYS